MFVPGVNGSVIPSAPSSSRLKGAYKNSKKRKMPNGGSIQSISPFGDVDASYGLGKNKLSARVDGSVNILGKTLNNITPSISYNNKGFNASVSPTNINANYNTDRLNLTGNVDMRDRSFSGANISGSYQVNPNLSLSGNYGVQKTPTGLDKNYFAGFRYSKAFEEGGEVEDNDDKEMVDGVASILRGVKSKSNRLQLANKMAKQFNREKVNYDLNSFLKKSKVKK